MPLEFKGEPINTIVLPESVTIFEVKAIHEALLSVASNSLLTLDLANTAEVDAAGMQLILAFVQQQEKSANPVQLINVSDELQATLMLLGAELGKSNQNAGVAL
ncbi:lipid asymmetry maintenance protein MlaB [Alteromonas oceani]|uniref:Lipid asymmetry maintenance protein MlaB n=1 Tax=Alteromonas oceani TaxID=2071609 RepID=A0ABV7JRI6_9ALTE|nr:STAS domain-containing protein [Alteromonas oceani]